jgi:HPt (histidine-containing phosphotransfer) domain-containing protein
MASEMAAVTEAGRRLDGRKASSRPVDLVHLSRYTLGERDLEREVLELFCTQSFVYLERLKQSSSDKDWKDLTHSLKGSARAVGAWRVAEAAERAERAELLAGDTLAPSRAARIGEIDASLREADAYIRSLLNDR